MTPQTRLITALVAGAAVLIAVGIWLTMAGDRTDEKGWSADARGAFLGNCVRACRQAPGMTEATYPLCDRACACGLDEAEKTLSYQELGAAEQALGSKTASPEQAAKIDRIQAVGMSCAMQAAQEKK